MGKLHQTLAVEASKLTHCTSVQNEAINTFSKKDHLFNGVVIKQTSKLDEKDELYPEYPNSTETVPVNETVIDKLHYVLDVTGEYYNLVAQKDEANTRAKADLVVGGITLLKDVPATTLLFLENKLKSVRNVIGAVKTLDQAKIWNKDPNQSHVYCTNPTSRTVKHNTNEWKAITEATEKHQAQLKEVLVTKINAVRETTELCGYITVQEKSDLLGRCDDLIEATKKARQTANDINVVDVNVTSTVFDYLMNGSTQKSTV